MQSLVSTVLALCLAALIATLSSGCSAEARKERHLKRANAYFAQNDYDKAEIEYINVLQREALQPDAIARLGQIYFDQTRLGRVFPYLSKARELQPENLEVRVRLSMFYVGVGRMKEAREEATFVLTRRPGDAEAPLVLADCVTSEADIEATRQQLQALPPEIRAAAPVLSALGVLEMRLRRMPQALTLFESALAQTPRFVPALLGQGNAHWAMGNLKQAGDAFAAAAAAAPARSPRRLQYPKFMIRSGDVATTRSFLAEVTAGTPDFLAAWVMLADVAAAEKKYEESLAALQKVFARDQYHPEAMLLRGRVRIANGEHEKAVTELEKGTEVYPQSPQLHHQLALAYVATGDTAKATAAATQAIKLAPGFVDAITLLAELNLRQRNFAPAIAALRQVVEHYPGMPGPRVLLGQALRAQGNLDAALEVYRQLERAFPRDAQAPLLSGLVLIQQEKSAEARAAFDRALAVSPEFLPAIEQLVNLDIASRQYENARKRVAPLVAQRPDSAPLHLLMAKIHLAEGAQPAAEASLLTATKLQPDLPLPYFLLARIYMNSQQPQKAIANLEQAVVHNPKDVQAMMLIGILQEQLKNYPAARSTYERLLAINGKFAAALNNLAYLLAEHFGEPDKAFEFAQRAREAQPGEPHVADTLGWVLYRKGQYSWAAVLLTESAEHLPESADVHFHLGMTQYMLGQEAQAVESLKRALALQSDLAGAERAREALAILAIDPKAADDAAIRHLEKAIANSDDSVAWSKMARIHHRRGALPEARRAYEAALKANPGHIASALELTAVLVELKRPEDALLLAKNTRKLAPTDPDVASTAGRLAFASGEHMWASSLLQEAAQARAADPSIAYAFGVAAYAVGNVTLAERELNRALELNTPFAEAKQARQFVRLMNITVDSIDASITADVDAALATDAKNPAALMAKAAIAEQKGDRHAAIRACETMLASYPEFTPAMRKLAILSVDEQGASARIIQHANKARNAFPDDWELGKALGILLYRENSHSRAAAVLREAAKHRPSDAQIPFYLGRAELALKDAAAAQRSLKQALELGLPQKEADEARRLLSGKS